jgi:hypothetical protein
MPIIRFYDVIADFNGIDINYTSYRSQFDDLGNRHHCNNILVNDQAKSLTYRFAIDPRSEDNSRRLFGALEQYVLRVDSLNVSLCVTSANLDIIRIPTPGV